MSCTAAARVDDVIPVNTCVESPAIPKQQQHASSKLSALVRVQSYIRLIRLITKVKDNSVRRTPDFQTVIGD